MSRFDRFDLLKPSPSFDFVEGYNDFVCKRKKNPPSDLAKRAEYLEGWDIAYLESYLDKYLDSYLNEIPSKQYP